MIKPEPYAQAPNSYDFLTRLNASEILVLDHIRSWNLQGKPCTESSAKLGRHAHVKPRRVRDILRKLRKTGFVYDDPKPTDNKHFLWINNTNIGKAIAAERARQTSYNEPGRRHSKGKGGRQWKFQGVGSGGAQGGGTVLPHIRIICNNENKSPHGSIDLPIMDDSANAVVPHGHEPDRTHDAFADNTPDPCVPHVGRNDIGGDKGNHDPDPLCFTWRTAEAVTYCGPEPFDGPNGCDRIVQFAPLDDPFNVKGIAYCSATTTCKQVIDKIEAQIKGQAVWPTMPHSDGRIPAAQQDWTPMGMDRTLYLLLYGGFGQLHPCRMGYAPLHGSN